ncbi:MAG: hypothetical protein DLM53_11410 [Candidatus Eremiobacter antarcticus]|nr:TIM barrel protein [Candidatus Eremiobacteraeota bacterium]PZR60274.1 MAG: hypothetical protein DLM53_11410 [Candidatus Eremiobacter sp. RRmetagenome_bin22]
MDQEELELVRGIEVGTASVNWGFDPLYTWVQPPPFDRLLDEMAAAGYSGTEISYHFPDDIVALRAQLDHRGLRAAASFKALDLRDATKHDAAIADVARAANRLAGLGSHVVIISDEPSAHRLAVAGRVSADGSDALDDGGWRSMAIGLNRLGDLLSGRGFRAVFHPHVGTYVETRAEIDRLCASTDPALIGLCPDTGHLAYAGASSEDVFRDYAQRIGYVHLKDVDGRLLAHVRDQRIGFAQAVKLGLFVELGSGMVSMQAIFGALTAAGYRGWVIVEQDAPAQPLEAAKRNRQYLRTQFGL